MSTVSFYEVKEVIGEEAAQMLIENFSGMQTYIPKKEPKFPDNETRDKYMKNLFHSSWSVNKIADEFGLSVETIRKIVNRR